VTLINLFIFSFEFGTSSYIFQFVSLLQDKIIREILEIHIINLNMIRMKDGL